MLMQEPTPELYAQWNTAWQMYKDTLRPNRKSGAELHAFLVQSYPLAPIYEPDALQLVTGNVLHNAPVARKLQGNALPQPVAYYVKNTGTGIPLYQNQEVPFQGTPIFVGIDLNSGFFCVEGSSLLWDELYVYRGLDAQDLQNAYCVAEYIACSKRFGYFDTRRSCCQPVAAR